MEFRQEIETFGDHLYAGGQFESVGGIPARNIARWNGSYWGPVGNGAPALVSEMDVFQGKLVICHQIIDTIQLDDTTFIYSYRGKLQTWDDTHWQDLDSLFEFSNVHLLGVIDDMLYFSSPDTINGIPINRLGVWDGNSISSIGDTLFHSVHDICKYGGAIYAACRIESSNPWAPLSVVRKWDGENWTIVGGIFDHQVLTFQLHDGHVFAGGFFEEYENSPMNFVSVLSDFSQTTEIDRNEKWTVYPNPATDVLFFDTEMDIDFVQWVDMTGRVLYQARPDSKSHLCVPNLEDGVYLLKAFTSGHSYGVKVVVER